MYPYITPNPKPLATGFGLAKPSRMVLGLGFCLSLYLEFPKPTYLAESPQSILGSMLGLPNNNWESTLNNSPYTRMLGFKRPASSHLGLLCRPAKFQVTMETNSCYKVWWCIGCTAMIQKDHQGTPLLLYHYNHYSYMFQAPLPLLLPPLLALSRTVLSCNRRNVQWRVNRSISIRIRMTIIGSTVLIPFL